MDPEPAADPVADYPPPPPLDPTFALGLSIARVGLWWTLLLIMSGVGYMYRHSRSKGWQLYKLLFAVLLTLCFESSIYLAYADAYKNHRSATRALYNCFIFFNDLASSAFLGLLLLLASGYNITRSNLGPHTEKVIFIPSVLLVTGLITDYIVYNIINRLDDKIQVEQLSTWEIMLWFVCSLINLAALLLAWVYIFDALQQETEALEIAQQVRRGVGNTDGNPEHQAVLNGLSEDPRLQQYMLDPRFKARLAQAQAQAQAQAEARAEDGGEQQEETVEERLSYEKKKRLLSRFGIGVSLYLVAEISVLLLPIFMIEKVQNAILTGSFLTQFLFMAGLIFIFRPVGDNPYLMVGHSAEDAEHLGLVDLTTELAMLEEDSPRIVPPTSGSRDTQSRDQNNNESTTLSSLPTSTRLTLPVSKKEEDSEDSKKSTALPSKGLTVRTQSESRAEPQFSLGDDDEADTLHEIHLSNTPHNK